MLRDDWLSRQIRELGEAIARAFDANAAGRVVEANDALAEGWDAILPNGRDLLASLDAGSAVAMLGGEERVRGAIALLVAEAELADLRGDLYARRAAAQLGSELARAARGSFPSSSDEATLEHFDRLWRRE
jgi:hypothetical protein